MVDYYLKRFECKYVLSASLDVVDGTSDNVASDSDYADHGLLILRFAGGDGVSLAILADKPLDESEAPSER